MKVCVWIAIGVVVAVAFSSPASAQVLYGATGGGGSANLYSINPLTGAGALIGNIGYTVTGLAVHPVTGVLYGSTTRNSTVGPHSLITINKTTGAGTLVGDFGVSIETAADISFDSNGVLYGWFEPFSGDLYTINTATGAATLVGDSGIQGTFGDGLAFNAAGTLYFAGSGASGALRTINKTTGAPIATVATLTGAPAPSAAINALAFNAAGVLYGSNAGNEQSSAFLVIINTTTGVVTSVGPTVNNLDAIAFDLSAGGCPTHVHSHTFSAGHGTVTHGFGHSAGVPGHGHHFACADHAPGHSTFGLQADSAEEFLDTGFVAALNQDGTLNGVASAARGSVLQLFGSAAGLLVGDYDQPAIRFTAPASGDPLFTTEPPEVRLGGVPAKVLFSGMAPGLTGVWQINILIPDGVPAGRSVPVTVLHEGREVKSAAVAIE